MFTIMLLKNKRKDHQKNNQNYKAIYHWKQSIKKGKFIEKFKLYNCGFNLLICDWIRQRVLKKYKIWNL